MIQKKIVKNALILCLVFSIFSAIPVFSADTKQQKDGIFTYFIEDGKATITNVDDLESVVTVPETLDGVPVTSLSGGAFGGSIKIEKVILPDTITEIGPMCFSYCTELTEVTLPANLTVLENGIFNHCTKLRNIELPDTIKVIEKEAFYRCDELWTITIPDGVTSIGNNAFAICPNLSAATIPESVTVIGINAFQKNDGFRLYAKPGSYAEGYARDHEIPFEELITVSVNGNEISFDQPPITDTENYRTLVPMRAVLRALNAEIVWDYETDSSKISLPNHRLLIRVGEPFLIVNGESRELSSMAVEYNWRTLVPIRDIIEAIDGLVAWDEDTKHITITVPIK